MGDHRVLGPAREFARGREVALAALPLESLFQLGFTVAFGLLVDTFVVRSVLVPSAAFLLGERNWWPSRNAGPERPAGTG